MMVIPGQKLTMRRRRDWRQAATTSWRDPKDAREDGYDFDSVLQLS